MSERPTGKRLMLAGKLAFSAGVIASLLHSFDQFLRPVLDLSQLSELLIFVGLMGTFLGAVAWMVGYLVFAISFTAEKSE